MFKKIKPIYVLTILLLIAVFSFVGPYLIMNLPFEYGGDLKPSWYAFYTEMKNLISIKDILTKGRLPFYSWDMFLGNNYWASKGFYGLADIFNYITLYIPLHFYSIFEIHILMKVVVAGLSFYMYLGRLSKNEYARLIGSILYALSSWFIFFIGQLSFASFYALLPFYLWGLEAYLQNKKKFLFILSTAFLLFTNYYLFYSVSLFTIIYYLYRYYLIHRNFEKVIINTLIIIFYYFVGVLMTGLITLPTVLYMLGSDRVGGILFNLNFYTLEIYFHQLVALLVPTHVYIYDGNAFETGLHTTRELLFWSSSLSALLVPQFIQDKDKAFQKATTLVYIIFALILLNPIGGSIMHGFSETSFRWTFLFIVFNITVAVRYLSDTESINLSLLKKTLLIYSALLVLILPLNLAFNHELNLWFSNYLTITLFYLLSLVSLMFLSFLLIKKPRYLLQILLIFTFIEMTAYASYNLVYNRMNTSFTWDFTLRATSVLQNQPNELNHYLNSLDENNPNEYYRVFVPHSSLYWDYSHNMAIHYELQGLMTYDSTYAPSFNDLKAIAPQVKDFDSNWIFNIKDANLVDLMNVKYAIVVDESELPDKNFTLITDSYRGSLKIYENNEYRALGNTYTKIMTYETLETQFHNDTAILNESLVVHEEDFNEIAHYLKSSQYAQLENISYYDNQLHGSINVDSQSFMVLTLPYDEGWKIQVNGQDVKKYQVNGGFMGIPLSAGDNQIDMYFVPEGFKSGVIMTGVGTLLLGVLVFISYRHKKSAKLS